MHEIEIGCVVAANRGHHGFVCAIADGAADAGFLAFELIFEFADRTTEIDHLGVVRLPREFWRGTIRTIKIVLSSEFRDDPRSL